MGFQHVALQPSQASIYTTFLKKCGRGYGLGTTMYPRTVVGGKQAHAPCKIFFLRQLDFMEIIRLSQH